MNDMRSILFYLGQFLSAMGSLSFNLCLVAFMPRAGFDLAQISLILGLQRFVPVFAMTAWGHLTDIFNAKAAVVILEVLAGLLSVALFFTWKDSNTDYPVFLSLCVLRAALVNFQTGSRLKISKLLSDGSYDSNAKHAIWQMKATQGATLFAGIMGILLIKFLTLKIAIILDFATFVINGLITLFMPSDESNQKSSQFKISWKKKFSDHFMYNRQAAILDIALAISVGGLISFFARVSGSNYIWNALFLTSYGLSVWIAGFIERSFGKKFSTTPFWIIMAASFILIGKFGGPNIVSLILMFIKDISYWIILHRISGHIQNDTPTQAIGGVASARFAIMIAILSIGEIVVGLWSNVVPLWAESSIRASIVLIISMALIFSRKSKEVISVRPAL